jgi:hypothetical protein
LNAVTLCLDALPRRGEVSWVSAAVPIEVPDDRCCSHLGILPLFRLRKRHLGPSFPVATWRGFQLWVVGPPVLGHDVSGIGWQTVKRAVEPITTMTPVRQYGHSCQSALNICTPKHTL